MLESFEPEAATYAIPQHLVDDYGMLDEFVRDFGKKDQQSFGSIQIRHIKGWTPESHVERIMQKIKPEHEANEAGAPNAAAIEETET